MDNDLYLKPEKCEFYKEKVSYLGFIITGGTISMDLAKWPEPTNLKQLRSFLGFGNFYRKFIRKYADLARPLNELLKKDQPYTWNEETQQSFDTLKNRAND